MVSSASLRPQDCPLVQRLRTICPCTAFMNRVRVHPAHHTLIETPKTGDKQQLSSHGSCSSPAHYMRKPVGSTHSQVDPRTDTQTRLHESVKPDEEGS